MRFGLAKMSVYRPKFTQFFTLNAKLNFFDNAFYRLSISLSSSEIFAIKLESFRKTY